MIRGYQKFIVLMALITGGAIFAFNNIEEIESGARNALRSANLLTVCDETLYYSLGDIDPRFGVSSEDVLKNLKSAEEVWERELGKNVFEYKEGSEFKINFIFDDRQLRTLEKDKLDKQLDTLEYNKDNLSQEYQKKYSAYDKALKNYEANLDEYLDKVEDFNREVEKLEKKGEMTKEKYEELKDEERDLSEMKDALDKERERINAIAKEVNKVVDNENNLVNNYNNKIETYKDKFGEAVEFNQGEYDGVSINIYQFHNNNDLQLVMVHELGHALSIGHVENSQSVMYYLMQDQDLENIKLTKEDLSAIKQICKMK